MPPFYTIQTNRLFQAVSGGINLYALYLEDQILLQGK